MVKWRCFLWHSSSTNAFATDMLKSPSSSLPLTMFFFPQYGIKTKGGDLFSGMFYLTLKGMSIKATYMAKLCIVNQIKIKVWSSTLNAAFVHLYNQVSQPHALWSDDLRLRAVSATYWLTLTVWRTLPDAGPDLASLANTFHFHGLGKPVKYSVVKSSD